MDNTATCCFAAFILAQCFRHYGAGMRLKVYRAPRMADAMARVRAELGPDALILASRQVGDGVEVTAALEPEDDLPAPSLAPVYDPPSHAALSFHGVPVALHAALGHGDLAARLGTTFAFAPLPLSASDRPLLLTGPPGAGKTLTTAKLAARLVMSGVTPLVISADGRRAGATEQLVVFTRVLNIDLVVADHPISLGRALARRPRGVPVLIDAPGLDPFDPGQAEELRTLAAVAGATTVLVMQAGLDTAEAADLAQAHAELGATLMIATKLDLTRRLGSVLSAADAGRLALTEAGVGPGVADGLISLTNVELATRLLANVPDHRA
jgi:flagellar biosynthesis protein FlhF